MSSWDVSQLAAVAYLNDGSSKDQSSERDRERELANKHRKETKVARADLQRRNTTLETEEDVLLCISDLTCSPTLTEDISSILSLLPTYPTAILSRLNWFYHLASTDQLSTLATFLLSSPHQEDFLRSDSFARSTDLHCAILASLHDQIIPCDTKSRDPLRDLPLAAARTLVPKLGSDEVKSLPPHIPFLLSQLPLTETFNRQAVLTWAICGIGSDQVSTLARFCKPPPPHTPLPVIHGTAAGDQLIKFLSYHPSSPVIERYIAAALPLNSANLCSFIKHLIGSSEPSLVSLEALTGSLSSHSTDRYKEDLTSLLSSLISQLNKRVDLAAVTLSLAHSLGDDTVLSFHKEIFISALSSVDLSVERRVKLAELLVSVVGEDETLLAEITETLFDCFEEFPFFNTTNTHFTSLLLGKLPHPTAVSILSHVTFSPEKVSSPTVPVCLIPKLLPKLTAVQIVQSMARNTTTDIACLSECLLGLARHNYPLHLVSCVLSPLVRSLSLTPLSHTTTSNIIRACELVGKQRDSARHHAPYLLVMLLDALAGCGSKEVLGALTPALHPLFDVCKVQGLQFLQARLSVPAKPLFNQLHQHYKSSVKYQGKT
eukprot:sb/3463191/